MSFLMGETKQLGTSSKETEALHKQLLQFLGSGGFAGLFPETAVDQKAMQPYLDLFTQQNTRNFAQAKESAGNLTGSGFGNILGARASEADAEQGAFLANLFEARRTGDANRMAQVLLGALGSPAGQKQNVYQPGFLDYAFGGASAAAPLIGAFGGGGGAGSGAITKKL